MPPKPASNPAKILYVDDEPANLKLFTMALADHYRVFTALSGAEALAILHHEPEIAVLVSDQRMPGMSGIELLEKAQASHPEIVRMMITAFTELDLALAAINRCHVHGFIAKPWNEELLLLGVTRAVETQRLIRENRDLSRRLLTVAEEERRRLARDLHDDFGRILPTLRFALDEFVESAGPPSPAQQHLLTQVTEKMGELGRICRRTASNLRPDILDRLGLSATLEAECLEFDRAYRNCEITLEIHGQNKPLTPALETTLYRVFQEGLNNIGEHAEADRAEVMLTFSHPLVILTIRDNGRGFVEEEAVDRARRQGRGLGLLGMRERTASMGGKISLRSRPGQGTSLRLELLTTENDQGTVAGRLK